MTSSSPVQLTGLIPEEDDDRAASPQVLPHDGDFGSPRLRPPGWGERQHGRGLWSGAVIFCQ